MSAGRDGLDIDTCDIVLTMPYTRPTYVHQSSDRRRPTELHASQQLSGQPFECNDLLKQKQH
jgi:hypothetical protein